MDRFQSVLQNLNSYDKIVVDQRRHRPDYMIVLFMGLLMVLGLIMMYAIGPQRANVMNNAYATDYYTATYFFTKQAVSLIMAVLVFGFFAKVPLGLVKKHAYLLLKIGLATSVLLAIAGWVKLPIAQCSLGACRWLDIGVISFQPAELLKFGLLVFGAAILGTYVTKRQVNSFEKVLLPLSIILALSLVLVVKLQNDLGTGISIFAILSTMLFVSGINLKVGGIMISMAVLVGIMFILIAPHRMARVMTFLNSDDESISAQDSGYHIKNAKIAIGTGGLFGVGIGNSIQATGYLPEAINDSVFAIMGETFGFVGLIVILVIFLGLLLRFLRLMDRLSDPWMRLIVAGTFGWVASHTFLNVAAITGLIPLTGITLPLLSFGGTSMVFVAGAIGLVFQMSSYSAHQVINMEEAGNENLDSRRGLRRSRHARRRSYS